jgi:hypothetical protein
MKLFLNLLEETEEGLNLSLSLFLGDLEEC